MIEFSGLLAVALSNAICIAADSSANDEVNERAAKVTPVEDGRIGRVAASHDWFPLKPSRQCRL